MTNMKMINANKILGNIKSNRELSSKYQEMSKVGNVEKISVSRLESDRLRMRKVSDKGTELTFDIASRILS